MSFEERRARQWADFMQDYDDAASGKYLEKYMSKINKQQYDKEEKDIKDKIKQLLSKPKNEASR
jgi:hypothetical protein